MNILFESSKGKVVEDVENSKITAYRKSTRDFDGIKDSYVYETTINYRTGLYTSESCTGYYSNYFDKYKNREKAIETAIREAKDTQILAKASDDKDLVLQSQTRITQLTTKYMQLCKISGLPNKLATRASVSGYKRTSVAKMK